MRRRVSSLHSLLHLTHSLHDCCSRSASSSPSSPSSARPSPSKVRSHLFLVFTSTSGHGSQPPILPPDSCRRKAASPLLPPRCCPPLCERTDVMFTLPRQTSNAISFFSSFGSVNCTLGILCSYSHLLSWKSILFLFSFYHLR